jgi:uncharacterized protein (DUF1499 family)
MDRFRTVARPPRKPMIALAAAASILAVWLVVVIANQFARPVAGGVVDGRLAPCPDSPNCVSSFADDPEHAIAALKVTGTSLDEIRSKLKAALARLSGMKIVRDDGNYLHVEARTPFLRFADDLELLIEPGRGLVQVRSASRIGVSDLGANRRRVEALRTELDRQ